MALADVCIHAGQVKRTEESGTWIEGEKTLDETDGDPFACVLFLPQGAEEANPFRPRKITRPTILYLPTYADGTPVDLQADDSLVVTAPELASWTGGDPSTWRVDGEPQPFGPPGEVIGVQATLIKVDD